MVCVGCFKKKYQVRIRGDSLKNQSDETIEEWIIPLNIEGFLEVQKDLISKVAFAYFQSEESAASFFYRYKNAGLSIAEHIVDVVPVLGEGYLLITYNMPTTPASNVEAVSTTTEDTTPTTPEVNSAEVAPTTIPTTPTTEPAWRTSVKRAITEVDEEIERLKRRRYFLELSLE